MRISKWIDINHNQEPVWLGDPSGIFSVKSAYINLRKEHYRAVDGETSDKTKIIAFWKTLWRIRIQNKVKIFLWRLFHNSLPVTTNLIKRGCDVNLNYWFCGYFGENVKHIILDCWWAHSFWKTLGVDHLVYHENVQNMADWLLFFLPNCSGAELYYIYYGARMVWFCRNSLAHGNENFSPLTAANITKDRVNSFLNPGLNFRSIWKKVQQFGNALYEQQLKLTVMDQGFRRLREEVWVVLPLIVLIWSLELELLFMKGLILVLMWKGHQYFLHYFGQIQRNRSTVFLKQTVLNFIIACIRVISWEGFRRNGSLTVYNCCLIMVTGGLL